MTDPLMIQEAREAPQVVRRQADLDLGPVLEAIRLVRPRFMATVARGSSDHACTFLKYAAETQLRLPVTSASPSVTGVYGSPPDYRGALVLAVSQSGGSPDVTETLRRAREGGALTLALVNVQGSPLAEAAEYVLPLCAGAEKAVAATKSFLAALTLGIRLLNALNADAALESALFNLPGMLERLLATEAQIVRAAQALGRTQNLLVLGRGLHQGVAAEGALKLQETAGIGALAFSTAEFAHGPARLLAPGGLPGLRVLAFQARDASAPLTAQTYGRLRASGVPLSVIGDPVDSADGSDDVPTPASGHRLTDPVLSTLAAQLLIGHAAVSRGEDPDAPPGLSKVTRTH
ncbi:SIS domain-containing protein [Deinococcus sp.]|uniref:SIS domain-containing protein n=1 Tax=Deinococcus sp. TaxID=47478 RepID=UPI003C7D084D